MKKKVCKAAEQVKEVVQNTQLSVEYYFASPVYLIERPDFLPSVTRVSEEALVKARKERPVDEIYPAVMTESYFNDPRVRQFSEFIAGTAWNILNSQGYAMQNKATEFMEMWTQEHYKHSSMEQHVHGYGSQIVGFYFLDVPKDSSRVVFYDPRSGKIQVDLPEQNEQLATGASKMINFQPKPGMFIFTNSWLAHAFTRNASDKPLKFVHFNLSVQTVLPSFAEAPPAAEVI